MGAPPDTAAEILSGLWSFLSRGMPNGWLTEATGPSGGLLWRVDHTWLQLQQVRPGRELFRCSSCQRVAPVSVARICPTMGCDGRLPILASRFPPQASPFVRLIV